VATNCWQLQHTTTYGNTLKLQQHCNYKILQGLGWQRRVGSCSTLPHTATHCHTSQQRATHYNCNTFAGIEWQQRVGSCNKLQHTATVTPLLVWGGNDAWAAATHCSTLQHSFTHCNCTTLAGVVWQRFIGDLLCYIYIYMYMYIYISQTSCASEVLLHVAGKKNRERKKASFCAKEPWSVMEHIHCPRPKHLVHQKRFYNCRKKKNRGKKKFPYAASFFDFTPCCQHENLEHYQSFNMLRCKKDKGPPPPTLCSMLTRTHAHILKKEIPSTNGGSRNRISWQDSCIHVIVAVCCSVLQRNGLTWLLYTRDSCSVLQCVEVCCSVLQWNVLTWHLYTRDSCSVLQRVVVCRWFSVLQCVTVCYSVLQCVTVCYSLLQCVAVAVCCSCRVLQNVAVCCSVLSALQLQCVAVCCRVSQLLCVAVCCSVVQLQCVAVRCSLL